MFGKLFKPRAHYVFDYKPRYYNERKERLKELDEKYHGKETKADSEYEISISKHNLRSNWIKQKSSTSDRGTTIRLALILAILVGIVAYLFELHTLF